MRSLAWGRPFAAISGEKDAPSQPPLVGPVLRAIYPDVDYRVLPGIGHWCMYEAPDAFNAALRECFCATVTQAATQLLSHRRDHFNPK